MSTIHNPNCDGAHCTLPDGEVRKLPTGGGANLILCHACFDHEIAYRRERNRELGQDAQFDLPLWSQLETYAGEREASLYQDLVDAGIPVDNHESDLYFQKSAAALEILDKYPEQSKLSSLFKNEAPPHVGEWWIEVPFAFMPFWYRISERSRNSSVEG
jgi:hypothetical protein